MMDILVDQEDGDFYQFSTSLPLENERDYKYHTTPLATFEVRYSKSEVIAVSEPFQCGEVRIHLIVRGDHALSENEFETMLSSISLVSYDP
ncbi:MAG: hypothetical protein ACSHX5_12920 [Phycisphaerales bacterium]